MVEVLEMLKHVQMSAFDVKWTPESAKELALEMYAGSLEIRRKGEEVEPVAFLMIEDKGFAVCPLTDVSGDLQKVQMDILVSALKPRYVVRVSEAWLGSGDKAALLAWKLAGRAMKDWPDREEVVMMTVDGPGLNLMLTTEIKADGTLGETKEDIAVAGRFTNLSGRLNED